MQRAVSRRRFLGTAGGALAGGLAGCFACPGILRAADDADRYGGFPLGIQSYTLRAYAFDTAMQIIHDDLGLHFVELTGSHLPVAASDEQIQKTLAKVSSLGIKIDGHGVNGFSKDHEANRRVFEFAKRAGIHTLSADPTEDAFDSLDKLVVEYDIRIAIHNHGPGARYDKVADVLTAIKGHHPYIGACADLGHYIRAGEDPVRVIHLLAGRLYGLHLKDYDEPKANARGVILGRGRLDVEGVFRALKKVEFPANGCLSLEYEESQNDPIDDVKQCLAACAEGAQKATRS
jgi:sugar phosphate isomerase/epimerase